MIYRIYNETKNLNEATAMSQSNANIVALHFTEYYTLPQFEIKLTDTAKKVKKDNPQDFFYIQQGAENLNKAISANPKIFDFVDKYLKNSPLRMSEKVIHQRLVDLLTIGSF